MVIKLILALILICHCSYRASWVAAGLFTISVGTIHNRLQVAAEQAAAINSVPGPQCQLFALRHTMRFMLKQPVLVGWMLAHCAICWRQLNLEMKTPGGFYLLEAMEQELQPGIQLLMHKD